MREVSETKRTSLPVHLGKKAHIAGCDGYEVHPGVPVIARNVRPRAMKGSFERATISFVSEDLTICVLMSSEGDSTFMSYCGIEYLTDLNPGLYILPPAPVSKNFRRIAIISATLAAMAIATGCLIQGCLKKDATVAITAPSDLPGGNPESN